MAVRAARANLDESIAALNSINLEAVLAVTEALLSARRGGHTVFIAGNGGSAATASHMATDLMLGSQLVDPPLRVIALTDNQAIITATGNDLNFDQIFARQLPVRAKPGDLLITVSASGNSPNILACIDTAKAMNVATVGFTLFDGGQLATVTDVEARSLAAYDKVERPPRKSTR
jgi:D-sedoheptulose 7-phosphate isomerase